MMRRVLAGLAALVALLSAGAAVASAPHTTRAPAVPVHRTVHLIVRPVHRDGTPVVGWHVYRQRIFGFTCHSGPSVVAVDPNIRYCGVAATNTVACWKSRHHTVLCLRDPRVHRLARIHYSGMFRRVRAPAHPSPQALALYRGGYCIIRSGGAWSLVTGHPHWFGTYSCTRGALYGRGQDGIDRSVDPWRVHLVLDPRAPTIRDRRVATAYFVGTACR